MEFCLPFCTAKIERGQGFFKKPVLINSFPQVEEIVFFVTTGVTVETLPTLLLEETKRANRVIVIETVIKQELTPDRHSIDGET